jgi:hypothetical protein
MSFMGKGAKAPKPKTPKDKAKAASYAKRIKAQVALDRGEISKKDYKAAAGLGGDRPKKATRKGAGGKTMS